ncbi:hypothetical protein E2C01_068752 [Portunus trituberculatus]|uniref:Uncharacterized protein n=1 Tax=Portunus trituberculatus TaxID=210409 RepID=A0A5B7I0Z1_PORTR|nr:hypothetical protein [Portunus trituberculatus]
MELNKDHHVIRGEEHQAKDGTTGRIEAGHGRVAEGQWLSVPTPARFFSCASSVQMSMRGLCILVPHNRPASHAIRKGFVSSLILIWHTVSRRTQP